MHYSKKIRLSLQIDTVDLCRYFTAMKIVVMGVSGIGIYKIRFSFSSSSLGHVEYVGVDMTYV